MPALDDPAPGAPAAPAAADSPAAELRGRASQVQEYLVALRGGAPFLSGADGQLLVGWLEAGIPVPVILSAVDEVADRRRRKRVQRRLTLGACRGAVEKAWAEGAAQRLGAGGAPAARGPDGGLDAALVRLAEALATPAVAAEVEPARARLVGAILALASGGTATAARSAEEAAQEAVRAVARFHDEAWTASAGRHEALRARAEGELSALRAAVSPATWRDLVEEVARDLLRQEPPAVSARQVWDTLAR